MTSLCARDLMTTSLITLAPGLSAREAWRKLVDNRISGAPVVDEDGQLVGVLSLNDLARRAFAQKFDPKKANSYYEAISFDEHNGVLMDDQHASLADSVVEDCMSAYVISVVTSDSVLDVATLMRERRIHRVIVTENGKLVGLISALDLLGLIQ